VKIVLVSTYELGRQPFGVASPAAWLIQCGHEVICLDLSRQALDETAIGRAELIAIYLPMHTATRLAARLIPTLREMNLQAHLCCYGLYAPMNEGLLRSLGVGTVLGGEFEGGLTHLAARLRHSPKEQGTPAGQLRPATDLNNQAAQEEPRISLERLRFTMPERGGLPDLKGYAHLVVPGGGYRVVGSTEASRGCKHLCRHCPIVPVYNGAFRIVQREVVLADIRQQVEAGAQHISFGDPDFFNGIGHALQVVGEFHRQFPQTTYDVTIKIEHLRKHQEHLKKLRDTGCLFVTSAVESVDDRVLRALHKGHTRADFLRSVAAFRELGMTLHPTFVPFTPWTTAAGYIDLLETVYDQSLVENVAPIQLGIRLLIPEGSRMLELSEVRGRTRPFDAESLVYPWENADPQMDTLSETVQAIAAEAHLLKQTRSAAFERIWDAAHAVVRMAAPKLAKRNGEPAPFLSEPWYCCAEPTKDQLVSIGGPQPRAAAASLSGARDLV
jgi:radical SAM superfamily enzyme YgiQ (UPF0313 family)